MKVAGITITDEQIAAGLEAMAGEFDKCDVDSVLLDKGIPFKIGAGSLTQYPADRVTDRLLQRERKAGRIKHLGGGRWQRA